MVVELRDEEFQEHVEESVDLGKSDIFYIFVFDFKLKLVRAYVPPQTVL